MKLNHKFALLLAGAVLAGSLTGCGASGTPASSAASSEAAASSAVSEAASEPAAEAALPDGVYTADFDTDSSMFHANEANDGKGTLTVKDGQMTFHVSLVSKKIVNLYVGMAADAEAHEGGGSGRGLPAGHPRRQGQVVRPYRPCRQRPACCGGSTCRRHLHL